jgi:hypothetical protein
MKKNFELLTISVFMILIFIILIFKSKITYKLAKIFIFKENNKTCARLTNEEIEINLLNNSYVKSALFDNEESYLRLAYGRLIKNCNSFEEAMKNKDFLSVITSDSYVINISNKLDVAKLQKKIYLIINLIILVLIAITSLITLSIIFGIESREKKIFYFSAELVIFVLINAYVVFSTYINYYSFDNMDYGKVFSTNEENEDNIRILEISSDE